MKHRSVFSLLAILTGFVMGTPHASHAQNLSPAEKEAGWISLFNGKDLSGWDGNPKVWRVVDGAISGQLEKLEGGNTFLISENAYTNFILEAEFILVDNQGNSGIQFRSKQSVNGDNQWVIQGYQADIGAGWYGKLYEEGGRGVLAETYKHEPEIKPDNAWNHYRITACDTRITQEINGKVSIRLDDLEPEPERTDDEDEHTVHPLVSKGAKSGVIALQYHSPGGFEVRFRNIRIKPLTLTPPRAPVLKKGDRLAVVGDSITEQKQYSKFIESYLQACHPQLEIQCLQLGWGGERAPGFANRMENDLVPWKPDVVTTCYGMNDGSYRRFESRIGEDYETGMRRILQRMAEAGATVVVGSPGVVDSDSWKRDRETYDVMYNENLAELGKIAQQLAAEYNQPHADVFRVMMKAMASAKAAHGTDYHVAGGDGVHPSANGHLAMAYAFLKAMQLDPNIATLSLDLKSGKASASDGHEIVKADASGMEVKSHRYPFCFYGNEDEPNGTKSIVPHLPFNRDLNQFILKVEGLEAAKAEVKFGNEKKTFDRDALNAGINLAAEFLDNPFVKPFEQLQNEVAHKQKFETTMIKGIITNFRALDRFKQGDAEFAAAVETIRKKVTAENDEGHQKVRAALKPVSYRVEVNPVN